MWKPLENGEQTAAFLHPLRKEMKFEQEPSSWMAPSAGGMDACPRATCWAFGGHNGNLTVNSLSRKGQEWRHPRVTLLWPLVTWNLTRYYLQSSNQIKVLYPSLCVLIFVIFLVNTYCWFLLFSWGVGFGLTPATNDGGKRKMHIF